MIAYFCFIAAALIEALAMIISVNGMAAYFGMNLIIMALAATIDIGAIACWIGTYQYWNKLNAKMKTIGVALCAGTMIFSASGVASFLMADFQKAAVGVKESALRIDQLQVERQRLIARKTSMEQQVAALREDMVTAKIRMQNTFAAEKQTVDNRLNAVETELNTLEQQHVTTAAKGGTIMFVAEMFGLTEMQATKWVVGFVVSIFTPLAFFLMLLGNFIKNQSDEKPAEEKVVAEEKVAPEVEPEVTEEPAPEVHIEELYPELTFTSKFSAPAKPAAKRGRPTNAERAARLAAQQAAEAAAQESGSTRHLYAD
jgi:cell division protein FtsB